MPSTPGEMANDMISNIEKGMKQLGEMSAQSTGNLMRFINQPFMDIEQKQSTSAGFPKPPMLPPLPGMKVGADEAPKLPDLIVPQGFKVLVPMFKTPQPDGSIQSVPAPFPALVLPLSETKFPTPWPGTEWEVKEGTPEGQVPTSMGYNPSATQILQVGGSDQSAAKVMLI